MPMTESLAQHVADAIRREMFEQKRQQSDLGEFMGQTQPSVSRKLAGKAPLRIDELQQIATFLGVPVSRFFPEVAA